MTAQPINPLVVRSPAKINLFLHVTGRRADGYHDLETAFQFLDFSDTIRFELETGTGISRIDDHDFSLPKNDLCIRAAHLLAEAGGLNPPPATRISLSKIIPPGSGMGGGSSNAATVLKSLNRLWNTDLDQEKLLELAAVLGADVPLFIHGKSCWATGIGDRFEEFNPQPDWYCFCIPPVEVSTEAVFNHPDLTRDHPLISAFEFYDGQAVNDLEPVARTLYPAVDHALRCLGQFGPAQLNGSGGSVFLRCPSRGHAESIKEALPGNFNPQVIRTLNDITQY